jgi:hypothetical protein
MAKGVGILKSVSANQVFEEFPTVEKAAMGTGVLGR